MLFAFCQYVFYANLFCKRYCVYATGDIYVRKFPPQQRRKDKRAELRDGSFVVSRKVYKLIRWIVRIFVRFRQILSVHDIAKIITLLLCEFTAVGGRAMNTGVVLFAARHRGQPIGEYHKD